MAHNHGKDDWTDDERVQRMVKSYNVRYDDEFWNAFELLTNRDSRSVVADFGCGPGLLLADIANRFKAHTAIALDESDQMLALAETYLKERTELKSIDIQKVNFDAEKIQVDSDSIDFAFSGFMLHEVASPSDFVTKVYKLVKSNGICVVYDFVSGNEEMFAKTMSEHGMSEEQARKRYPHMCKHSADDIVEILEKSGFSDCRALIIGEIRAVVVGLKR
ncbi:MAG: class I SAM-dependent methyltransferase [Candidatus Thorarchaeota archaeon]|nr:class I SAM-dependent methyltransferase [Candidatus Thorarchaeota archaeon]